MPSLKHCSGVWFTMAGTGSEETAIDNTTSAGGGWNVLVGCRWRAPACSWGTCCQVSNSQEGTDWDLPIPSCLDDLSCPSLSILFLLPALPSIKSPRAKIFTSCLNHFFILKVIFWDWRDWLHRGRSKSKVNAYLQAAFALCLLRRSAAEERHSSTVASSPLFVTLKIH